MSPPTVLPSCAGGENEVNWVTPCHCWLRGPIASNPRTLLPLAGYKTDTWPADSSLSPWLKNPQCDNSFPRKRRECRWPRAWRKTSMSKFCTSLGHLVHHLWTCASSGPGCRWRLLHRWWRWWLRTPASQASLQTWCCRYDAWQQRLSMQCQCPERHSQHCCQSHYQWKSLRTHLLWLPPC